MVPLTNIKVVIPPQKRHFYFSSASFLFIFIKIRETSLKGVLPMDFREDLLQEVESALFF